MSCNAESLDRENSRKNFEHFSSSNEISTSDLNSVVDLSSEIQAFTLPMDSTSNINNSKKVLKTYSKQLLLKSKHIKYRLIRKSPLKGSPVKNLTIGFLRKHKKSKSKGVSPRKLKFILPKLTKFSPRKLRQPRLLKSKSMPLLHSECAVPPQNLIEGHDGSDKIIGKEQCIINPEIEEVEGKNGSEIELKSIENISSEANATMQVDENEEDELDMDQQQKKYLAAFLKASSTIAFQKVSEKKLVSNIRSCEQKLTKQQRRLHERIFALSYVPELKGHQEALVLSFLLEVKDALSSGDGRKFEEFLCTLENFSSSEVVHLYYKVTDLLQGYPDLQEAFVMFLKPEEAIRVGKYTEYLNIECIRKFSDELKHHANKQPQNLQKVIRTLDSLLSSSFLEEEHLMTSLTPILKLQPWLLESFSKCIPKAKPQCSLPDDFEEIDLDRPCSPNSFEQIFLQDDDGKGSTDRCFCQCHYSEMGVQTASLVQSFKSEHCLSCALRFIDGRVFLQCGRTVRLAKVFFQAKEHLISLEFPKGKIEGKQRKEWRQYPATSVKFSKALHKGFENSAELEKASGRKGRKSKKN